MLKVRIIIAARPPFSLRTVIRSHGWIQLAPFRTNDSSTQLNYVAMLNSGNIVEIQVHEEDKGVIVIVDESLDDADELEITDNVAWMLGLDHDFSPFYALAREEPKLSHAIGKAQGRVLRSPTLFEDTVKTILTTNTSWSGTIRMVNSLVSQYGSALPSDDSRQAFPTPDQLAQTDEETLRAEVRLGYRAPYVLELAKLVSSRELDLERFKMEDLTFDEVRQGLLAIKGVGGYAVANLLMLLGHYREIPVDSWARKMVSHEWHKGEKIGREEVERAFAQWEDWKGLAFWLWNWTYRSEAQEGPDG